ncbi:MAG: hypothetical protein CMB99_02865 [Flavobacteriaceae bacterium]|nr:hypothetical protein [Flavobacteriaceae bacterium]|tara:strand:+ start:97 stop:906 length:810 start_codon:yes stop_codon:yes gene_type:complete
MIKNYLTSFVKRISFDSSGKKEELVAAPEELVFLSYAVYLKYKNAPRSLSLDEMPNRIGCLLRLFSELSKLVVNRESLEGYKLFGELNQQVSAMLLQLLKGEVVRASLFLKLFHSLLYFSKFEGRAVFLFDQVKFTLDELEKIDIPKEQWYRNAVIFFGTNSEDYGTKPNTGFDISKIKGCKDSEGDFAESNFTNYRFYFRQLILARKNIHYFSDGTIASVLIPKEKSPSNLEMMFIKREASLQGVIVHSRPSDHKEYWLNDVKHREWH